jgi:signal transduction histidine kinase
LPDELFEPYKTTKPGGSGIGLWHVRQLVNSLNGSVSADNAAEGGAWFVLRLPREGFGKTSRE